MCLLQFKLRLNGEVEVIYLPVIFEALKNETIVKQINLWLKTEATEKILIFLDPSLDTRTVISYVGLIYYVLELYMSELITENCYFATARTCFGESNDSVFEVFGHQFSATLPQFSKILYIGQQNVLLQNLTGFFIDKPLYWKDLNSEDIQEVNLQIKNRFLSQRYVLQSIHSNLSYRRYSVLQKFQGAKSVGVLIADIASRKIFTYSYLITLLDNIANSMSFLMQVADHLNIDLSFISVGKLNEAKISNFNDLDGFILLSCHNIHPNTVPIQ